METKHPSRRKVGRGGPKSEGRMKRPTGLVVGVGGRGGDPRKGSATPPLQGAVPPRPSRPSGRPDFVFSSVTPPVTHTVRQRSLPVCPSDLQVCRGGVTGVGRRPVSVPFSPSRRDSDSGRSFRYKR